MEIKAILFDLDGVLVSTDEYHYLAWKSMADAEGIYFDREINERLRGVSRMESLSIILEKAEKEYSEEQRVALAESKNDLYREHIKKITPADSLPGAREFMKHYREQGLRLGIGSSSKNCPAILQGLELADYFDVVVDGNGIANSKPDPEVFLKGASGLGLAPAECLVVEDADAGVEAALAGGMPVLAVGPAAKHPNATYSAQDLCEAFSLDFS